MHPAGIGIDETDGCFGIDSAQHIKVYGANTHANIETADPDSSTTNIHS